MKQIKSNLTQLAKNLRTNQTDAEKLLWKHLKSKRLTDTEFRRQQPIGNYIVDFVSFDEKLIVELDGGQHFEDKKRDQKRDNWFIGEGFKVLRFWNNDVLRNTECVLETIMKEISPSPTPSPQGRGNDGRQSIANKPRMIAW